MSKAVSVMSFCLVMIAAAAPASAVFPECEPEFAVELTGEDKGDAVTTLQFSIEVSTTEPCAEITFDLVIEFQLPNGQTKRVRKPQHITLRGDSTTHVVEHRMTSDLKMLEYETQLADCKKCEAAD
jgi:hypothetical protein